MPMTCATCHSKDVARRSVPLIGRSVVGVLSAVISTLCLGCRPQPPDIADCTRIEVHYTGGALNYFIPGSAAAQGSLLTEAENRYLRSCDTRVVSDHKLIEAFATSVNQGVYRCTERGVTPGGVRVVCYRGSERLACFTVHRTSIITDDMRRYEYPLGVPNVTILEPAGVKPLKLRWECAMNLSGLLFGGLKQGPNRPPCPDSNQWCDVIVRTMRRMHITRYDVDGKRKRQYPDRVIARRFTCPAVHAPTDANGVHSPPDETDPLSQPPDSWVSDYAMNSNCREGSPDDMVFLFESRPGWNEHGGAELFTFGNHDPKGGCVLLNDGTVKFIRTKEELHALRWK